uniref:Uncharacterized protein n=1 Tax=Rhizophora mucronata TaxID=61149 RepID=A0A2P2PTE6_RHIMU
MKVGKITTARVRISLGLWTWNA